jgi:hypothetical protein
MFKDTHEGSTHHDKDTCYKCKVCGAHDSQPTTVGMMITDLQRKWLYTRGGRDEQDVIYMKGEPYVKFRAGRGKDKYEPVPSDEGITHKGSPNYLDPKFLKHLSKKKPSI